MADDDPRARTSWRTSRSRVWERGTFCSLAFAVTWYLTGGKVLLLSAIAVGAVMTVGNIIVVLVPWVALVGGSVREHAALMRRRSCRWPALVEFRSVRAHRVGIAAAAYEPMPP